MALRVWLPLNGDLENKGISDVTITNNGATVDDNGKIGKCYYFNGSSWIKITMPAGMSSIKNSSVCAWVKSTGSILALGGISNDTNYADPIVTLYTSGWQFSGNGNVYKYLSGGTIANTNVWHHVCCTVSETTIRTYLDGTQIATNTLTGLGVFATEINANNFIEIGCDHPGGNEFLTGYVNDFRIYDHCLSQKEVKEIFQGLVLHYKLNGLGGSSNNIISYNSNFYAGNEDWSNWGTVASREIVNIDNKSWAHIVKQANVYGGYSRVVDIRPNTIYTVSATFYASASTKGILWWHYRSSQGGANLSQSSKSFDLTTTPTRYSATVPIYTNSTYTVDRLNLMIGTPSESFGNVDIYFTDVKIEVGNIATPWIEEIDDTIADSSGYNNYGSIHNIDFSSENGPRYNVNADFYDNYSAIELQDRWRTVNGQWTQVWTPYIKSQTISFWWYSNNWQNYTSSEYGILVCNSTNFSIDIINNNIRLNLYTTTGNTNSWNLIPLTNLNTGWHYFAFTYNNKQIIFYLDGIQTKTINITVNNVLDYFLIQDNMLIGNLQIM